MYSRLLKAPSACFFLLGPRGTGKSLWTQTTFQDAVVIDLLKGSVRFRLQAQPDRIDDLIGPDFQGTVIIDEVQRLPDLLNEVHRLIESRRRLRFVLTGSSARKLRRSGVQSPGAPQVLFLRCGSVQSLAPPGAFGLSGGARWRSLRDFGAAVASRHHRVRQNRALVVLLAHGRRT
jgi:hypothetical protein